MAEARNFQRYVLPAVILAAMALAYAFGLHRYFSLAAIAENRVALESFTSTRPLLASLIYFAIYVAAVSLSLPGAVVLTIAGGFLFGWLWGGTLAVLAATLGATLVFAIARTAVGASLAKRAGPALVRLKQGFERDAFSYLLILRLVPAFPFWIVNIAPALSNVSTRTFTLATLLGIIPGTFAYSYFGRGLGSVIDQQSELHRACIAEKGEANCTQTYELSSLVTREVVFALLVLAAIAMIPLIYKKWKGQNAL